MAQHGMGAGARAPIAALTAALMAAVAAGGAAPGGAWAQQTPPDPATDSAADGASDSDATTDGTSGSTTEGTSEGTADGAGATADAAADPATDRAAGDGTNPDAGAYLAARAAAFAADFADAPVWYDQALAADPDNPALIEGALLNAVALGDFEAARGYADRLAATGGNAALANLVALVDDARQGQWDAALVRAAGSGAEENADRVVVGLTRAWALIALGRLDEARAVLSGMGGTDGLGAIAAEAELLVDIQTDAFEDGLARLDSDALRAFAATRRGLVARAGLLAGLGRRDEAKAALDAVPSAALDPILSALRARLDAPPEGDPAADAKRLAATPEAGLAQGLLTVALALAGEGDPRLVLLYARAALALDPALADAALLAAEVLRDLDQDELASEVYAAVPADDPAFVAAEMGRADSLRRGGDLRGSAEVLTALAQDHPRLPDVQAAEADALFRLDELTQAEAAYGRAIDLVRAASADGSAGPLWYLHYRRAVTRQAADDWPGAEADLREALTLDPQQATVLNHLGYSLADRGDKLDEALGMIQRAVAMEPANGAIVDSLGWVYYRLGRYDEAVGMLERAAALEATDPVVNDHLGDAYWKVGRTREALFQWRRALSFVPADGQTDADPDAIRAKIEGGLAE